MAPSCQIPWAILHQIFVKWNHTCLPEDVQNQQRSKEMTMIHRVLIMNIIHVLAHGDTDEIRPSDMDNKCCICWFSVLSILFVKCIHDYIFTYITQLAFHICWVILSIELFWHDFHTQAHWQELLSALDSSSDLTFGRFHKYFYYCTYTGGIIHATQQNDRTTKDSLLENCS